MPLALQPADEGGCLVTSPMDPELITQAETIEEAFAMARDAAGEIANALKPLSARRRSLRRPR
jgi:antitoxin HicB